MGTSRELNLAIRDVKQARKAFCRFITANDIGATGGHQSGFYIPKAVATIAFNELGVRGENLEKLVHIHWQDNFCTSSRFIYYGKGTRNEYRLTRFGKNFPFFCDEYIGALMIVTQQEDSEYTAYVLNQDEDIESFFNHFAIAPTDLNRLINQDNEDTILSNSVLDELKRASEFPSTARMAEIAQALRAMGPKATADDVLLSWVEIEYKLFRKFEQHLYQDILKQGFNDLDELILASNSILNRRKSRAGKSLEHHLARLFDIENLKYEAQAITEGNKRPDFIFPGSQEYHNFVFPSDKLSFLAAKTTCKDRWRQILNEADRIPDKHLFTLQQGISAAQLREMIEHRVQLVVPSDNKKYFPNEYQAQLIDLSTFIQIIRAQQS